MPIWLATTEESPARVVAMRLPPVPARDALDAILGLAAKYDLVLFDARGRRVHLPLEAMAAHASATFWPGGAIQAAVAGAVGLGIAVAGWLLAIPLLGQRVVRQSPVTRSRCASASNRLTPLSTRSSSAAAVRSSSTCSSMNHWRN